MWWIWCSLLGSVVGGLSIASNCLQCHILASVETCFSLIMISKDFSSGQKKIKIKRSPSISLKVAYPSVSTKVCMSQLASNTLWQQDWNFHNQPGLLTHLWLNLTKLKLIENIITKHKILMLVPSTLVFLIERAWFFGLKQIQSIECSNF